MLLISKCVYLHSSRVKGCPVILYTLYLLPLYCLLSPMLFHLLLDSCQYELKPGLTVYVGKLLGVDFVAKPLVLTVLRKMSDVRQCLHTLLPNKDIIKYWILSEATTTYCHRLNWPCSKTVFDRCLFSYIWVFAGQLSLTLCFASCLLFAH